MRRAAFLALSALALVVVGAVLVVAGANGVGALAAFVGLVGLAGAMLAVVLATAGARAQPRRVARAAPFDEAAWMRSLVRDAQRRRQRG